MIDPREAAWPLFGWDDDVRPALRLALGAGQPAALATLVRVEGSAPRGPGAQMLFHAPAPGAGLVASGYFSGDCIEGDVALHAAEVLASGEPQRLHYGAGSPWIDLRLRCGGALHVHVERIAPYSAAARDLLHFTETRRPCLWRSAGAVQTARPLGPGADAPLFALDEDGPGFTRRYDPRRRLVVTGGDPGALAVARLASLAGFETVLVRSDGPESPPPFPVFAYSRARPAEVLGELGVDRWTAYLGATHEDEHDLGGCLSALKGGAGYVGMIGARSRSAGRAAALAAMGATPQDLAHLRFSPGVTGLGKAPWEVATGILAEVMQALNPMRERA